MNDTEVQLKRIQTKLQQLLKNHSALQKENEGLKDELARAQQELAATGENLYTLKQQVEVLKYSNGDMDDSDKKEFEKKINLYVKEIDRCIVMLSQ